MPHDAATGRGTMTGMDRITEKYDWPSRRRQGLSGALGSGGWRRGARTGQARISVNTGRLFEGSRTECGLI